MNKYEAQNIETITNLLVEARSFYAKAPEEIAELRDDLTKNANNVRFFFHRAAAAAAAVNEGLRGAGLPIHAKARAGAALDEALVYIGQLELDS